MAITQLNPAELPLVSIDFMNRTHLEELEIVNSLFDEIKVSLSGSLNDSAISQRINNWLEHTQAHFSRENELMQETGFPAYKVHSEEHKAALNRMQAEVDNWQANKNIEQLQAYVTKLWPDWFMAHVNTMDKVTAEFAVMNGYAEE